MNIINNQNVRLNKLLDYNPIKEQIGKRIVELESVLMNLESNSLWKENIPNKRVRVVSKSFGYQYYLISEKGDTNGKYADKKVKDELRYYAQRHYDEKVIKKIKEELELLKKMQAIYAPDGISKVYSGMNDGRKLLVEPVDVSDEEYAFIWQNAIFSKKELREDGTYYETLRNEKVRSKSEVIIADTLMNRGIPYHYEKPIYLKHNIVFHPDFTVLNVKKRKTIYIEHLGLIDDRTYLNDAINRIDVYEENGIVLGDELLITYESVRKPFQRQRINSLIDKFLI